MSWDCESTASQSTQLLYDMTFIYYAERKHELPSLPPPAAHINILAGVILQIGIFMVTETALVATLQD